MRDRLMFNIYRIVEEKQKQNCPINKWLNFSMRHIKQFSIFLTLNLCALNCNDFCRLCNNYGHYNHNTFVQLTNIMKRLSNARTLSNTEILQRWTVKSLSFKLAEAPTGWCNGSQKWWVMKLSPSAQLCKWTTYTSSSFCVMVIPIVFHSCFSSLQSIILIEKECKSKQTAVENHGFYLGERISVMTIIYHVHFKIRPWRLLSLTSRVETVICQWAFALTTGTCLRNHICGAPTG